MIVFFLWFRMHLCSAFLVFIHACVYFSGSFTVSFPCFLSFDSVPMLRCVFLTMCFSRFQTMAHFSKVCYRLHPCRDMTLFLLLLGLLCYASQFFPRFEPHGLSSIFALVLCLCLLMLCVFFCLHVWRNGLRSRADLLRETRVETSGRVHSLS